MTLSEEECRALAQRICAGDPKAVDDFLAAFQDRLLIRGSTWLRRRTDAARIGSVEELLQSFLVEKIVGPGRIEVFRPISDGERPFWPQVKIVFLNFLRDQARRANSSLARKIAGSDPLDKVASEWQGSNEEFDHNLEVVAQRVEILWNELPADGPVRFVMLFAERLWMAELACRFWPTLDQSQISYDSPREFIECLSKWPPAIAGARVPGVERTMADLWEEFCDVSGDDFRTMDAYRTAARLFRTTVDAWHHRTCRGRDRLSKAIGKDRVRSLFAHWPAKATRGGA